MCAVFSSGLVNCVVIVLLCRSGLVLVIVIVLGIVLVLERVLVLALVIGFMRVRCRCVVRVPGAVLCFVLGVGFVLRCVVDRALDLIISLVFGRVLGLSS